MVRKKKKNMPEKITTDQISTGIKVMLFVIPFVITGAGTFVSISYTTGQTTEKIKNIETTVQVLNSKVEDSARVKEQTAIDIAVVKTEMKNMSATLEKIEDILTNKRKKDD